MFPLEMRKMKWMPAQNRCVDCFFLLFMILTADQIQQEMKDNPVNEEKNKEEDKVFMQSYIPTTLDEVIDVERDTLIVEKGDGKKLVYADLLGAGVTTSMQNMNINDDSDEESEQDASDNDGSEDEEGSESEDDSDSEKARKPKGKKNEDKDEKRERKQKAKEEARERRKHKLPKAEKKRKIKVSSKKKK